MTAVKNTRRDLLVQLSTLVVSAVGYETIRASAQTAPAEPRTILFSLKTKKGREEEFARLAATLAKVTREEDAGCLAYLFLQQRSNPREFVLFEQWRDEAALKAHLAHLQKLYGPPPQDGRSGVPAAILDLAEQTRAVGYRVIA